MKQLSEGIQGYGKSQGYDVVVQDPNLDPQKQVTDLQSVIESGRVAGAWAISIDASSMKALVEKAQATVDAQQAEELARKIRDDAFTLEDFATQLKQLRSMGPLGQILDMVPFFKGARGLPKDMEGGEEELHRYEAIIASMTPHERREPAVINGSRRARIARGSGTSVSDVNRLLKQYAQLKKMMKGLKQMEGRMGKLKGALPFLPR